MASTAAPHNTLEEGVSAERVSQESAETSARATNNAAADGLKAVSAQRQLASDRAHEPVMPGHAVEDQCQAALSMVAEAVLEMLPMLLDPMGQQSLTQHLAQGGALHANDPMEDPLGQAQVQFASCLTPAKHC